MRLGPPSAATAEVRFSLAGQAEEPVEIPAGAEVATVRTSDDAATVFQLIDGFTIPPLRPTTYAVQRGGQIKDVGVADGRARPAPSDQTPSHAAGAGGRAADRVCRADRPARDARRGRRLPGARRGR